jgi:uncharacterized phage protein (TIGR02218 family)
MKSLHAGLAAHLAGGATTLCWCWRLTRRDGIRLGFTDHDRDLAFDDTTFEASAGFTASEMRDAVGLSVDNMEVESALTSARIEESDILAGLYDDAAVEIFRVNWQAPDQRVLMRAGTLGEVRRNGIAFAAEVRGLSHYLQQPAGRLYQLACDADLGDARCKVDLDQPTLRGTGTVASAASLRLLVVAGLAAHTSGWFSRGLLRFTSGANAGRAFEVKRHAISAGEATIELWQEPAFAPAVGDAFVVTAGCDKEIGTCAARFANVANFRGFPHMPGNDFVTAVSRPGSVPPLSGSASPLLGGLFQ